MAACSGVAVLDCGDGAAFLGIAAAGTSALATGMALAGAVFWADEGTAGLVLPLGVVEAATGAAAAGTTGAAADGAKGAAAEAATGAAAEAAAGVLRGASAGSSRGLRPILTRSRVAESPGAAAAGVETAAELSSGVTGAGGDGAL